LKAICLSGFRAVQESRTVKAPTIASNRNALGFPESLLQLQFVKPPDLLVPTARNGVQRKNLRPIDLVLAANLPGAQGRGQFQNLIRRSEPILGGKFSLFDRLERLGQKRADTGQQDLQVGRITSLLLRHGADQFQLGRKQGDGIQDAKGLPLLFRLDGRCGHRTRNAWNAANDFDTGFEIADLEGHKS